MKQPIFHISEVALVGVLAVRTVYSSCSTCIALVVLLVLKQQFHIDIGYGGSELSVTFKLKTYYS